MDGENMMVIVNNSGESPMMDPALIPTSDTIDPVFSEDEDNDDIPIGDLLAMS